MKKNFLNSLSIDSNLYVYNDYSFQTDDSFVNNGFTVPENEVVLQRYTNRDIINKLLPGYFFEAPQYHETKDGNIESEKSETGKPFGKPEFGPSYSYLITESVLSTPQKDDNLKSLDFKKKMKKYSLKRYGQTFYAELGNTDFSSFDNLLSFVETWGLPTGISTMNFPQIYPSSDINIFFMPLDLFYRKIDEYQRIFNLFKALATNDFTNVQVPNTAGLNAFELPIEEETKSLLGTEIHYKGFFSYRLKVDKSNSFTPQAVFNDMFEFAYFFLTMAVYRGAEMRECENCGNLFEVTHQRQRFCPPLPGRKRSSCEMAYNNRLKKERKQKGGE